MSSVLLRDYLDTQSNDDATSKDCRPGRCSNVFYIAEDSIKQAKGENRQRYANQPKTDP